MLEGRIAVGVHRVTGTDLADVPDDGAVHAQKEIEGVRKVVRTGPRNACASFRHRAGRVWGRRCSLVVNLVVGGELGTPAGRPR